MNTNIFSVLNASSLFFGLPYMTPSSVTIVSAPITKSGLSPSSMRRFSTSTTLPSAVASTNSENVLKSLGFKSSSNKDGTSFTCNP